MSIGVLGHMGFFVLAVGICSSSRFKSRRVLLLHDPHQQRAGVELQAGCSRFCTSTVTAWKWWRCSGALPLDNQQQQQLAFCWWMVFRTCSKPASCWGHGCEEYVYYIITNNTRKFSSFWCHEISGRQEELQSTSEQRLPTKQINLRSSLPRKTADQQLTRRTVEWAWRGAVLGSTVTLFVGSPESPSAAATHDDHGV